MGRVFPIARGFQKMARKNTGKPNGKPPFKPTEDDRKTVELMAAVGIIHADICLCIGDGIDVKTLKKYFQKELDTALVKATAKVAGSMFNKAVKGDVGAGRFWLSCRAGWKETSVIEGNTTVNVITGVPRADD